MKHCLIAVWMLLGLVGNAQGLYHKWFGKAGDPAVVFLHGGPGYNAASFEMDMAARVADLGYQVLVYDQRGCGRSEALKGEFTYAEAVQDLDGLLDARGVKQAHLLGHSFGGTIAVKYAEAKPERVRGIVLISAPMDFPECFRSIQANVRLTMEDRIDSVGLRSLAALAASDTTTLVYSGSNFMYAMANGLYTADGRTKAAEKLAKKLKKHALSPWLKRSSMAPVQGFFDREHYTLNDHFPVLEKVAERIPVSGIYGEEDGLFTTNSLQRLENVIGGSHMYVFSTASHAVFLDDPYGFLDALGEALRYTKE